MPVELEALFSRLLFLQLSKDVKISMSEIKARPTIDGWVRKGIFLLIANVIKSRRNNNCPGTAGLSTSDTSHLPFLVRVKKQDKEKYAVTQAVGDEDATSGTIFERKNLPFVQIYLQALLSPVELFLPELILIRPNM